MTGSSVCQGVKARFIGLIANDFVESLEKDTKNCRAGALCTLPRAPPPDKPFARARNGTKVSSDAGSALLGRTDRRTGR